MAKMLTARNKWIASLDALAWQDERMKEQNVYLVFSVFDNNTIINFTVCII
jgi:hypothetical protein